MTALYVPPTDEADHKKQNQSLQLIGSKTTENTTNIATNTTNIATNTTNIALLKEGVFSVKAYGAVGDNFNDDTSAIAAAITAANGAYDNSGIVYFPPGGYKTTSKLTVPNKVSLVGAGAHSSSIFGTGDIIVLDFTGPGRMTDMFVAGYQNAAATQPTVQTGVNQPNIFRDCYIWGGLYGLNSQGTDGYFENCFIAAMGSSGAHLNSANAANWYVRCKFDDAGFAVARGAVISASSGTQENHFTQCDFSGSFTSSSILIDDTTKTRLITVFDGCVFSGSVTINNGRATMLYGNEFGSAVTVNNNCITLLTGNYAFGAIVVAGTNTVKSGNFNIT